MPSLQRSLGLILGLFLFTFLAPLAVDAASCGCFCGDNTNGAVQVGTSVDGPTCNASCERAGKQFVGCFTDPENYPAENELCWTEAECDAYSNPTVGGDNREGIWGRQHYSCVEGEGHCFSTGIPVTLNVPILGVSQVTDIATYIDLAYRYLLPTAALIAVVLAMIAGVQYATAGGNQGQVTKAKQRLGNAIIGIVLLLSAYVIARLIDPRLVTFDAVRVPLVKQVVLLDPGTSCEVLKDYGFVITSPLEKCGMRGQVIDVSEVDEEVANSNIKVGDTCPFISCPNLGEACMSDGVCRTCEYFAQITPSESLCQSIASLADANDPDPEHLYQCFFEDTLINSCVSVETNSDDYINCKELYSDAPDSDPCSIYQTEVNIDYVGLPGVPLGYTTFQDEAAQICQTDPCGVTTKKPGSICVATLGEVGITCATK